MQENINIPDSTITTNLSFRNLVLMNIQQLTNFPYIEKDFDALTDYELLCLVVKFLNDVIANQNKQNDSISRMYESFLALQDYVNNTKDVLEDAFNNLDDYVRNYFDNLDVQDEINNKLDQMLEDGVLEGIIESFLQSNAIWTFDTVAEMKQATNFINGSFAKTLGYYTLNDGGASVYKIRNIESGETTDEKYKIAISETLLAELILEDNQVNIIQLGSKSDNSTDVGAIINEALNKDIRVYVPLGTYLVTTTIHPKGSNELIIDGALNYTGNDSCIKIDTSRNVIKTKAISTTNGIPVLLENSDTTGTRCANNRLDFNGLLSSTNNHAMYLHAIARGIVYNEIQFDTLSAASDKYALYIKTESAGEYAKYVNENTFYGGRCSSGLYGIYIDTGSNGTAGECNNLKFYNVALEGITNGIYINNARWNYFNEPRINEISSPNKTITIAGGADGNIFNINSLIYPEQIDITNLSPEGSYNNFINGEIAVTGGLRVGRNLLTYNKKLQLRETLSHFDYKNLTPSVPTTFDNTITANYFLISNQDNKTYVLNQYYGSRGINEIYLTGAYPCTIKDNYDNTVIAFTPAVVGTIEYVKVTCYNLNGTDTWLAQKITIK